MPGNGSSWFRGALTYLIRLFTAHLVIRCASMTKAQRALVDVQTKQSELRSRLAALSAMDARNDEQETELSTTETKLSGCEPELRAALAAAAAEDDSARTVQTTDAEGRERIELRSKTGLADFLKAAAGGTSVNGAAAEYAASLGVPASGHLPMALFAPTNQHLHIPTVETRAVTPGPAVKGMLQPTIPFVFERSAAASLGIMMPTVPSGQVQIPKITTAPPSDTLAKDGAAPSTAAAVTLVNQAPVRIAGQLEVRVEDLAVMPSLESSLSESLQGSMSNELDEQVFNGAAGDLNGLFTQAANVGVASAVETFATGIARFASLVDGRHAYTLSDVRAVIGSATFGRFAGQFSGNGSISLFDYLTQMLGSIRVSDRVPSVSSNAQKGIVVLSASAEMPKIHVWDAMQIVRDPYSGAGAGKVTITATSLVSPLYIPHSTSQVKEIHPKVS